MIIGVDGNEANIEKRVGVNVYAFELLRSIYELSDLWKEGHQFVIYLQGAPRADLPKETDYWKYKILPGRGLWILRKLTPHLFFAKERPDIFFTPSHYLPPIARMPVYCSIMDLGYLETSVHFRKKDYWQLVLWSAWSMNRARKVFAISESTKRDIVRHYPSLKDKVVVTPLGYDSSKFHKGIPTTEVVRVKSSYGIGGDYILFLSTLKPSKNVSSLIKAFKVVSSEFKGYSLVIAGKKGWMYDDIFAQVKALNLESRVIFTDYVDEADKPGLIAGSRLFVLPSFWEGFGIDALSAMACGVPVVVSNVGSLPEVVGDAGVLVNPNDVNDIAEGLKKILSSDKRQYNMYVEKGLAQAKKFSWEETARQTLKGMELI